MENAIKPGQKFLQHGLRLGIYPKLETLNERRRLLSHLKRFGDVLVLKSLYYDKSRNSPNSALVIFREKQSFDHLTNLKSFNFKLRRRPFDSNDYVADQTNPSSKAESTDLNAQSPALSAQTRKATSKSEGEMVEFKVQVEPWKGNHRSYIERTPYWSPFEIIPSMIQQQLQKIVPLPGLSDVSVDRPPLPLATLYAHSRRLAGANAKISKVSVAQPGLVRAIPLKAVKAEEDGEESLSERRKRLLRLKEYLTGETTRVLKSNESPEIPTTIFIPSEK